MLSLTKTNIGRQHRLHKRHLQLQLKEWNDVKADSTTVHSLFKELQVHSDLFTRMQKERKQSNEKEWEGTTEENYHAVGDEVFTLDCDVQRNITEINYEYSHLSPANQSKVVIGSTHPTSANNTELFIAKFPQIDLPKVQWQLVRLTCFFRSIQQSR